MSAFLDAGPNAFSTSLTGADLGLLYKSIFSTNLGFTVGYVDSWQCRCGFGVVPHCWQHCIAFGSTYISSTLAKDAGGS